MKAAQRIQELLEQGKWEMATVSGFSCREFADWFGVSMATANRRIRDMVFQKKARHNGLRAVLTISGKSTHIPTYVLVDPQDTLSCHAPKSKSRKSGSANSAATAPSASAGKTA